MLFCEKGHYVVIEKIKALAKEEKDVEDKREAERIKEYQQKERKEKKQKEEEEMEAWRWEQHEIYPDAALRSFKMWPPCSRPIWLVVFI